MNDMVYELAAAFSVALEDATTFDEFELILSRNASETNPAICHSHDVCDANQVMLDVMAALGIEYNPDDDRQCALVNRAWTVAKRSGFNVK